MFQTRLCPRQSFREAGRRVGIADEILKQLEILGQDNTKALYALVMNYAESGRYDEAFIALQKCFDQREEKMIWMKNEPRFANLRNDSRYQDILQRMKL
ncbi:MAG: hypothetical protein WKF34_02220 [Pyrinomonadaceae bacterium]